MINVILVVSLIINVILLTVALYQCHCSGYYEGKYEAKVEEGIDGWAEEARFWRIVNHPKAEAARIKYEKENSN